MTYKIPFRIRKKLKKTIFIPRIKYIPKLLLRQSCSDLCDNLECLKNCQQDLIEL